MLLSKNEIEKIAKDILKRAAVMPTVSIRGDINRAVMGGKGGGASVSIRPNVTNPTGMQTDVKAPALPAGGETNGKSTGKT
jgi:hypothetical protein